MLKQWLDPTDRALFARASKACRAAVVAADLPQFHTYRGLVAFPVKHFGMGGIQLLRFEDKHSNPTLLVSTLPRLPDK